MYSSMLGDTHNLSFINLSFIKFPLLHHWGQWAKGLESARVERPSIARGAYTHWAAVERVPLSWLVVNNCGNNNNCWNPLSKNGPRVSCGEIHSATRWPESQLRWNPFRHQVAQKSVTVKSIPLPGGPRVNYSEIHSATRWPKSQLPGDIYSLLGLFVTIKSSQTLGGISSPS